MYDAIIVGARCAGSPTAMLLARRRFKVLLVDKATFPSDTISTHILWPHGAEILGRWGLPDRLARDRRAAHLPADDVRCRSICAARHDSRRERRNGRVLSAPHGARRPSGERGGRVRRRGSRRLHGRRTAGRRRHGRRHSRPREGSTTVEERARIVIGADGVNSFVARTVRAPERRLATCVCAYYSYFSGVRQDDIELYVRDHFAFGGAPTNDGLHLGDGELADQRRFRPSVATSTGTSGGRSRRRPISLPACAPAVARKRWYGTAGVPGYFRKPYGKGWALVGDASYNRDPITAQGISDAFIDAEIARRGARRMAVGTTARSRGCWRPRIGAQRTRAADVSSPPSSHALPRRPRCKPLRCAARQPGRHQRLSVCDHRRHSAARFHVAREHRPHHGRGA